MIRSAISRQLQMQFSEVLSQCVFLRFTARRMSFEVFQRSRSGFYSCFVEEVRSQGLNAFLKKYPLAANAISLLANQARKFAEDFALHLAEDYKMVLGLVDSPATCKVHDISAGWSDPHRGGRSVVAVTFDDGRRAFYKPRSLATDAEWQAGVKLMNTKLPLAIAACEVADLGDHGWTKGIAEDRNLNQKETNAYYWRFGAILALAWLVDATDLHRDNFVVSRNGPIPVDLECVMHPLFPEETRTLARTGIIPVPGVQYDVSALGTVETKGWVREISWLGLGTDDLRMTFPPTEIAGANHPKRADGTFFAPMYYQKSIVAGFEETLRIAREHQALINDWRERLSHTPRRIIYRPTAFYAAVLRTAASPRWMSGHTAWRDWLNPAATASLPAGILDAEIAQLSCWDIPVFESPFVRTKPLEWDACENVREELIAGLSWK
jgi:lantibiotic modifying enzyme